jgi:hypothetical protein
MAQDVVRRLGNQGDISFFEYHSRQAALIALKFSAPGGGSRKAAMREGWGLCVELENTGNGGRPGGNPPLLLALAYGPAGKAELEQIHLSALDSVAPSQAERRYCGPVTEFAWPRGEMKKTELAELGITALMGEGDAPAAQALVDREYAVLGRYADTPLWQEAWTRFYRAIYRDSWERLADAAFQFERYWAVRDLYEGTAAAVNTDDGRAAANQAFAARTLAWVQSFAYERDAKGSDFVNLVSAAQEGRGDCDSRAMLWAIMLAQANIPSSIMVSKDYSHAMGLGDVAGAGARFEMNGKKWLVAETTSPVALGLIREDISGIAHWLGISFE